MKISFFVLGALLFLAPQLSQAYQTTNQAAVRINESTALYSITFALGHGDHATYVPAVVGRNSVNSDQLGFRLVGADEATSELGRMTAQLVSDATLDAGYYVVPAGTRATFTLYALLAHDPIAADSEDDYALQVNHLPFYFDAERRPNRLNPSELQYYITPELDLDEAIAPRVGLRMAL